MPTRFTAKDALIPVAIFLAGLIVAGAVYYVRIKHQIEHGSGNPAAVRPVSPADHIVGNPTAPVIVVEYGDIDSVYSKQFQLAMEQLMTEYAAGGKVAWVYRHFPLTTEHVNASANALAAECAASLSVPSTFFRFIDAMQAAAPGQNQFNPNAYGTLLGQFDIDATAFKKCVTDGTYTKRVHDDYDNALSAGATGSPFVILLVSGQPPTPINGALPYSSLKKLIDQSITKSGM